MVTKTMKSSRTSTEVILLVEDEEMVSDVTKRILEKSGYTVLTAGNGKEALDIYEKERDRIGLVILDLIMPEMGGKQCLEQLRNIDPDVKVLVISGYSPDGSWKQSVESGAKGFVGKPFDAKQLLEAVREALDSV